MVKDKENGRIVPVANQNVLSQVLSEVIEKAEERQRLAEKAVETVRGLKTAEEYFTAYKNSLQQQ